MTVEETVELAPVSTPTPRRRAPRPRAAAKPDAESPGDGAPRRKRSRLWKVRLIARPAQEEARQNHATKPLLLGEPEAVVSADPDSGSRTFQIVGRHWSGCAGDQRRRFGKSPPIERPVEPTGDGRADLNHRNRARDSRGRRDRGPRPRRANDPTAPSATPAMAATAGRQATVSHGSATARPTPRSRFPPGRVHPI